MAIRRNISVLNQGISSDIDIVYGTDLVPIEFYITDYSLPDNAIATLYCTTSDNESHKDVGEIANNVITFNPVAGFFGVGKNKLQIRITADEKNLFSFEMCANCKSNITNDDAVEVDSQPTLVTQLLTEVGNTNAKLEAQKKSAEKTNAELKKTTEKLQSIAKDIYPVGSIYMSINPTNPSELFGGTWEAWGSGRVPVGVDTTQEEFETVQKTGGEKTHTLTINEMPAHNHGLNFANNIGPYASPVSGDGGASWGNSTNTVSSTGENKPHNNLQPYITCYMWLRTE